MTDLIERSKEAAARFLDSRGYEILERDYECDAGNVDIVAMDDDTIVFVEVMADTNVKAGFPAENITDEKRSKYEKIALSYLSTHDTEDMRIRFDCIALVVMGNKAVVKHHVNAFSCA